MTTEPNGVVQPIHEQAMPVILMTADQVDAWLKGTSVDHALAMAEAGRRRCARGGATGEAGKEGGLTSG